jgi:hypothetical protein
MRAGEVDIRDPVRRIGRIQQRCLYQLPEGVEMKILLLLGDPPVIKKCSLIVFAVLRHILVAAAERDGELGAPLRYHGNGRVGVAMGDVV